MNTFGKLLRLTSFQAPTLKNARARASFLVFCTEKHALEMCKTREIGRSLVCIDISQSTAWCVCRTRNAERKMVNRSEVWEQSHNAIQVADYHFK